MELLKSIRHPDEVCALLKFKFGGCNAVKPKCNASKMSANMLRCYELLNKTSRSFSAVIQALDGELRHAVCIFYLVLRALDTVEDDMSIPLDVKVPMLRQFHTYLLDPEWRYLDSSEKDRIVLEDFPVISSEFRSLKSLYRDVISESCQRMGEGMTVFLTRSPGSMEEWNEYCHYVAGIVGIGLSQLFSASHLESAAVGQDTTLANSMGLFLQKTNIIRDYLEDVQQDRKFWPQEVWGKYAKDLQELSLPERRQDAVTCLNELITDALGHVPDVIKYLSRINNQSVFNFCAIPQVMAIATLERCYNNPAVFTGVVKIRKGEAVKMMMQATDLESVKAIFMYFALKIQSRIPASDASCERTRERVAVALADTRTTHVYVSSAAYVPLYVSCAMLLGAIAWQYWTALYGIVDGFLN